MKRICLIVLLFAVSVAIEATGDEVTVGQIRYADVKILSATKVSVTFRLSNDRELTKALASVTVISLDGCPQFDAAEKLFAAGKYEQAVAAYEKAFKITLPAEWQQLILSRQSLARKYHAEGHKPPVDEPKQSKPKKCPYCRGAGFMPCTDCHATGLTKCTKCNAVGRITCPGCKGQWGRGTCDKCGGSGSITKTESYRRRKKFTRNKNVPEHEKYETVTKRIRLTCPRCGGHGYDWKCLRCSNQAKKLRGTVKCPVCHGSRRSGTCSRCNGTKKLPCKVCGGSGLPPGAQAQPATTTQPTAPTLSIKSVDQLAEMLHNRPTNPRLDAVTWAALTSLQQQEAIKSHEKALAEWDLTNTFVGQKVSWSLVLDDVRAGQNDCYTVRAVSEKGSIVTAILPPAAKDSLLALSKSSPVTLAGVISQCRVAKASRSASPDESPTAPLYVRLENATVVKVE